MSAQLGLLTSCVRLGLSCASAREQDLLEQRADTFVGAEEPSGDESQDNLLSASDTFVSAEQPSRDESQDEPYQGGHVGKTDMTTDPASCVVVSIMRFMFG